MLYEIGKTSEEEMAKHPDQSSVLKCLGGNRFHQPDIESRSLDKEDKFILCSDGLWENIKNEDMLSHISKGINDNTADLLANLAEKKRRNFMR